MSSRASKSVPPAKRKLDFDSHQSNESDIEQSGEEEEESKDKPKQRKKNKNIVEEEASVVDDDIEEFNDDDNYKKNGKGAVVPYSESAGSILGCYGSTVIRSIDDLRQYWMTAMEEGKITDVITAMMTEDLANRRFSCSEFFMMEDFVSKFEFKVNTFRGKFDDITEVYVVCPVLCGKRPLEIRPPPLAIRWFTGLPLGNYHPWDKDNSGTNNLKDCEISAQFSLTCPPHLPELEGPLERFCTFVSLIKQRGAEFIWNNKDCAKKVKDFLTKRYKNEKQRKAEFFSYPTLRNHYLDEDKTNGDPRVISARSDLFRVCYPAQARKIEQEGYRLPFKCLQEFHERNKPKCKEGKQQLYYVLNKMSIIDTDGSEIPYHELKELAANDPTHPNYSKDQMQGPVGEFDGFVLPRFRTTIANGEQVIPLLGMKFTEFINKDAPNYGLRFTLEGQIRRWKAPPSGNTNEGEITEDGTYHKSDIVYDWSSKTPPSNLMKLKPLPGADMSTSRITHSEDVTDDDMMAANIPEPSQQSKHASESPIKTSTKLSITIEKTDKEVEHVD